MSSQLGSLAIVSGADETYTVPNQGVKGILIGNESGITVTVTMESGQVSKTLYPSTLDWFAVKPGFSGNIKIHPYTILSNISSWPASSLIFDAIGLNDTEEAANYPQQLTRNTNIGNTVTTTGGTASSIVNDNSALGTQFIESTPTGTGTSTVSIKNDGTVTINGDVAAVIKTLLQLIPTAANGASSVILGDAGRVVEILGPSQFDGNLNNKTGQNLTLVANGAEAIALLANGATQATLDTNGLNIPSSINPNMTGTTINGGTSGTAICYQVMQGTIKMAFIILSNFKTAASNQTIAFPVAFTATQEIRSNDTEAFKLLSSSNPVTVRQMTAFGAAGVAGSTSATSTLNGFGFCWNGSAIDTIQFNSGWASAHSGTIIIIGT